MKTFTRRRASALCALMIVGAAFAAPAARAATAGAYLVHSVTETSPAAGGDVVVDTVRPFDPRGGLAIFEPGSASPEVFTYAGIDDSTSELTGVVRTAPAFHPGGSFVQAIANADPSPSPRPSPRPRPSPSPKPTPQDRPSPKPSGSPPGERGSRHDGPAGSVHGQRARGTGFDRAEQNAPQARTFDTGKLTAAASQLLALRWSKSRVTRLLYRPFPVAGATTFTNTWGALRYGPAPGQVRGHEGQDLFCDYGTPLLAVTPGRIQFDTNGLGGRIARLHRPDGSYWYYAHLSGWNRDDFSSGDHVEPGDVIGYCGHSGDALGTPNHLHFGWYSKEGEARNPMKVLVAWLRVADRKADSMVSRALRLQSRTMGVHTLGRMFGEAWAPDLTVVAAEAPAASPSPSTVASPSPTRCAVSNPAAPLADCLAPSVPLTPADNAAGS